MKLNASFNEIEIKHCKSYNMYKKMKEKQKKWENGRYRYGYMILNVLKLSFRAEKKQCNVKFRVCDMYNLFLNTHNIPEI